MKYCGACGMEKPLTDFGRHRSRKDGLRAICRVCNAAKAREWERANPDKARATRAKYYRENAERSKARSLAWLRANPDKRRAIRERWNATHPDRRREANAQYRAANKGARAAHDAMIRVRKYGGEYPEFGSPEWRAVVNVYDRAQAMSERDGVLYHVDHIVPIAEGGRHFADNLQIITAYRHRLKSSAEQSRAASRRWAQVMEPIKISGVDPATT